MDADHPVTFPTVNDCIAVDQAIWSKHIRAQKDKARRHLELGSRTSGGRHWQLLAEVVEYDPRDWSPFGLLDREQSDTYGGDCSSGCVFYLPLKGSLGMDWGVCTNPGSHRLGKLTFEHQGCYAFQSEP